MIGPTPIADRGTFSSARPALIEEIEHLLVTETGEEFLKKLFWEVLSFDRVSDQIPLAVLPAEKRTARVRPLGKDRKQLAVAESRRREESFRALGNEQRRRGSIPLDLL
jgi:hypothetical protein